MTSMIVVLMIKTPSNMYSLKDLPPASQNNSRAIVQSLIKKWEHTPSEALAERIQSLTGWVADWSDNDWGNGPQGYNQE